MAEFVHQSIEEMLPEVEQMERVGLFNGKETRAILKKRKAHEYRLRRRTKQKEDFLQYIQYEISVLALVRLRREKIGYHHKHLDIDVAIVHRIHKLFKLACFRFQNDVKLWLSYIDFCKKKGEKSNVSKMYTKMLQVHNRKPDLWISAAKFEIEFCSSMENARQLLQRGLRFNPKSKDIWREYFRMELLNAEKMRKRQKILGVNDEKDAENQSDAILQGKVAEIVYKNASQNFDGDVEFVLSLLPICRLFPFTKELEKEIFRDIQNLHANKELTWDAIARQNLHQIDIMKKREDIDKLEKAKQAEKLEYECYQTFKKAVTILCTEKMYDLFLKACLERLRVKKLSERKTQVRTERCLHVFEEAASCHCLSENMAIEWINILKSTGTDKTLEDGLKHVTTLHPTSVALWKAYLSYLVVQECIYKDMSLVFKQALAGVNHKDSLPLWQFMYDWLCQSHPDQLESYLEMGLTKCSQVCIHIKEWYMDVCATQFNIQKTRTIYKRLSAMQPLSLTFFEKYINIENSQLKINHDNVKKIRSAFEDAVREYGQTSPEIWLNYIKMEIEHPQGERVNVGKLHWRAVKTLESSLSDEFVAKYTFMQNEQL